ncbi:uncharacterized protein [Spinacia oleracea]|uniref:Uncharacterized protein n=1 Tax=Spinacia oleracea TaxID=3562 RepID=A0A9R0JQD4_SPIOL|nr:uncharacterized protein LOC110783250 [Spinacia oleracea]
MASMQQADHGVNQLSDEEKAAIGEAMKEAESLAKNIKEKAVYSSQDKEVLVTGVMKNFHRFDMELYKITSWTGKVMDPPPVLIRKNSIGTFVHKGTSNLPVSNSKGAIIYSCNKKYPHLGWLLAWDKSDLHNKVYVEAGKLDRIKEIPDCVILQKLDASGNISRYWDNDTGASANAEIRNWDESIATLGVSLDQEL